MNLYGAIFTLHVLTERTQYIARRRLSSVIPILHFRDLSLPPLLSPFNQV